MYEDLNSSWLEVRNYDYARIESGEFRVPGRRRCAPHLPRRHLRTMLRDEAYHFIRLGTTRSADNTARILDVKYTRCCRARADVGGPSTITSGARSALGLGFESYR
jgi:uncharacterized alpha-E superfamily protein